MSGNLRTVSTVVRNCLIKRLKFEPRLLFADQTVINGDAELNHDSNDHEGDNKPRGHDSSNLSCPKIKEVIYLFLVARRFKDYSYPGNRDLQVNIQRAWPAR